MAIITTTFTADSSGNNLIFTGSIPPSDLSITAVSLREVIVEESQDNPSIKEFLVGNNDDGKEIFFRADTQQLQLLPTFEVNSNPVAIATRMQRGTLVKCFVALDDDDFYEISGTVNKGVSIVKITSKDQKAIASPPNAKEIRVSWRDSSMQLCRIIQTSIIFMPGKGMDFSE